MTETVVEPLDLCESPYLTQSSQSLGAAFGPVVLCLLYYKKTTGAGVAAGMLAGFLTSVIWVLALKEHTYDLYEALPGFIVGGVVTMLVSILTANPVEAESPTAHH